MREVVELSQNPPEGIKVILNEGDITDIQATIEGPGSIVLYSSYAVEGSI